MFAFYNKNSKILFYFWDIIKIYSYPIEEFNPGFPNTRQSFNFEKENKLKYSQTNHNTSVLLTPPTPKSESEIFKYFEFDLTSLKKEEIIYNSDQQDSLSFLHDTGEEYSQDSINELHKSEKSGSSEQYEEIDTEIISIINDNIHSDVIVPKSENDQIVNSVLQDSTPQVCFNNVTSKPYISNETNISCSKTNNDYGITRCDDVSPSSIENLLESEFTSFDFFKTNETHKCIYENVVSSEVFDYEDYFISKIRTPQYSLNTPPSEKNIKNNITYEEICHSFIETKTVIGSKRNPINIIDNVDLDHSPRIHLGSSYDSISSSKLHDEPSRKMSRNISTAIKDNSSSISSVHQIVKVTDKNITDTKNQASTSYTFSPPHDYEKYFIHFDIMNTNTRQKTFHGPDLNKSHPVKKIPLKLFQVPKKDYDRTNDGETSLKKISGDFYNLNFSLNDTQFSWIFNHKTKPNLLLEISFISIKSKELIFDESVFNISINNHHERRYLYFVPIFHTVDFESSSNIDFFRISVSSNKYEIKQKLEIYIYQSIQNYKQEFHLKCPYIHDFKQLINKLLETTFPIYSFPISQREKIINFFILDYNLIEGEIAINKYIKGVTENPLNIRIKPPKEYNLVPIYQISKRMKYNKNKLCWDSGLEIVYDVFKTFHINITRILMIIDDNSKTLDYKKIEINYLLNQIIRKIKINCKICYSTKKYTEYQRGLELMSFYAFCKNEVQYLFEWWNKYVFVIDEVQYIESFS